mgnify:CR=1 FL=1
MKDRQIKLISDCIKCRNHIMQASCSVVCSFFKDSYRELPLILCDDPSLDYIEGCPKLLRNASDMKSGREYKPRAVADKSALRLMKKRSCGQLIKLFG